jgi:putative transcriptional regulator
VIITSSYFDEIMEGLNDALEHAKGNKVLRTHTVTIKPAQKFAANDIKRVRVKLGLTQSNFACVMSVSTKTVEAWEAGTNIPNGPACRLLSMMDADPELPSKFDILGSN